MFSPVFIFIRHYPYFQSFININIIFYYLNLDIIFSIIKKNKIIFREGLV
jgi:hypothetical protein